MKYLVITSILVIIVLILLISQKTTDEIKGLPESQEEEQQTLSLTNALAARFTTLQDVKNSQWYNYLKCLYSDLQIEEKIPFTMNDFWILKTALIPSDFVYNQPAKVPTGLHSLFWNYDVHVKNDGEYIFQYQYSFVPSIEWPFWGNGAKRFDQQFPLFNGLNSHALVEVLRSADAPGNYVWFYYMPGSGNWLNLGKTKVFKDHSEAFEGAAMAGVVLKNTKDGVGDDQTKMGTYYKKQGFDTLQFTFRSEYIFKYEIMDLRKIQMKDKGPCVDGIVTKKEEVCACNPKLKMLNCEVVPTSSCPQTVVS